MLTSKGLVLPAKESTKAETRNCWSNHTQQRSSGSPGEQWEPHVRTQKAVVSAPDALKYNRCQRQRRELISSSHTSLQRELRVSGVLVRVTGTNAED